MKETKEKQYSYLLDLEEKKPGSDDEPSLG